MKCKAQSYTEEINAGDIFLKGMIRNTPDPYPADSEGILSVYLCFGGMFLLFIPETSTPT